MPAPTARSILELRYYRLRNGPQVQQTTDYLQYGLVPACERAGIGPVGCFSALISPDTPSLLTVIRYASLAAIETARETLAADAEFQAATSAFNSMQEPYVRMETSLLRAFAAFPDIVPPAAGENHIFELRTYESPNQKALERKIKMFAEDGEMSVFQRLGLAPVFFGETIAGPRMPSLAYMLTFDDLAARERLWGTFIADPEWHKIRSIPGTSDAEIVNNISTTILRPLPFSGIR